MQKRIVLFFAACVIEVALFGSVALRFFHTASASAIAFVLTGGLIIVSTIAATLFDLRCHGYQERRIIARVKQKLKRSVSQEGADFALRGIGGGVLIAEDDEKKPLAMTENSLLRQERQLYRDALFHGCDYAYIVNVNANRFHDVYKGDFLDQYLFDSTRPYDEAMERVVERMSPVILHGKAEEHLTTHYIAAYEQGKRIMEVEYYIPDDNVYKRRTLLLSKGDDDVLYAFVVAHDITDRKKEEMEEQTALAQLAETAKKVGSGHLDVIFDTDIPGHVGVLAEVLNQTILHLKWHMERLEQQAAQDPLTGVKNKRAWQMAEKRLDAAIQLGTADFAVAVCDINKLKQINDTAGHEVGDSLIIRASRYICKTFQHSPVYRIGGDEFAVILEGTDLDNCERLVAAFYKSLAEQSRGNAEEPPVSMALGSAHYTQEDETFSEVFQRADKDMYRKKAAMKASTVS